VCAATVDKERAEETRRWNVFESTGVWEETASSVKLHAKRTKVTSKSIRSLRAEEGSSDITEEKTRESEADTLFRIEKICRDITVMRGSFMAHGNKSYLVSVLFLSPSGTVWSWCRLEWD
jgi:hypothetical protein